MRGVERKKQKSNILENGIINGKYVDDIKNKNYVFLISNSCYQQYEKFLLNRSKEKNKG